MKRHIFCFLFMAHLLLALQQSGIAKDLASGARVRVVIMADMGNEPDEMQQMVHMLMYSNELDLEGLIAVSGYALHSDRKRKDGSHGEVHPEMFIELIDAYSEVLENLKLHAKGWHDPNYLKSIVSHGTSDFGTKAVGPGKATAGSKLVMDILVKDDPRPVYFVANAGTNTLAQALRDLGETKSQAEMDRLCEKIIVYENRAQDDCGVWITLRYPTIRWYRSIQQTYAYAGLRTRGKPQGPYTWEPYPRTVIGQHQWAEAHIMNNHGPLGKLYPYRMSPPGTGFIEGGGTSPWIGLAKPGVGDPQNMHWGGWGGRFSRRKYTNRETLPNDQTMWSNRASIVTSEQAQAEGKTFAMFLADTEVETWNDPSHGETFTSHMVPIWRWRRAMFNDFQARMDWCVKPWSQANHNPIAAINGDTSKGITVLQVKPGQSITLDGSATADPDDDDLFFNWWVYKEAGTYQGEVIVVDPGGSKVRVEVPEDARGKQMHVILEVHDTNPEVALYDHRRIIFDVSE